MPWHSLGITAVSELYESDINGENKAQAKAILKAMRFESDGYFFAYDSQGVNTLHAIKPQLEGKNLYSLKDENGVPVIAGLIDASKSGDGFLYFSWHKPSIDKQQLSLSSSHIPHIFSIPEPNLSSKMDDIIFDALTLIGINILLWIWSLYLLKTWPVDFIWSNFPIYLAVAIYKRLNFIGGEEGEGNIDRIMMAIALISVWGFRLTQNFYMRGGIGHEDWRYEDMRDKFGKHFWWISLFSVFLGQTIFLFLPCLSLYGVLQSNEKLGFVDWVGFSVIIIAILLETIADTQMNNFIAAKKEKRIDEAVCKSGLWGYSRHPNYLGEILFWWGLYLLSLSSKSDAWMVIGPISITFLFVFVSVKLMEDRQLKNKGEKFKIYQREVGSSLLLLPKVINKFFGEQIHGKDGDVLSIEATGE